MTVEMIYGTLADKEDSDVMKARLGRITHVLATVTLIALPATVAADPYAIGPPSGGYRPDNSEHTYCWGSDYTGDNPRNAADESMLRLQSQTTMTKNFVGNCGSATDARFATGDLGGADGSYNCTDRDGSKCFHAVLTFDRQNITSYNDWRQTTCHEIGHSVGLTHEQGSGDCMGYNSSNQSYSPHHVDHINNDR